MLNVIDELRSERCIALTELESRGINFYAPAKQPTSEARQLAPS